MLEELEKSMIAKTKAMERVIRRMFKEMNKNLVSNPKSSRETKLRNANFVVECAMVIEKEMKMV